ncbi:MAG: tautomerase family protein [bacterium]|nr:tautomerase family protein [bacterium]
MAKGEVLMALAEITVVQPNQDVSDGTLIEAVREALVVGLRVPVDDPTILVSRMAPSQAVLPGGLEAMILVKITMFVGRSLDTRESLHALVAQELKEVGVPVENVRTVFVETPVSNWGVDGSPQDSSSVGFDIAI